MTEPVRHGDVLLIPVKSLPKNFKKQKDTVVAYGEATGHNHAIMPTKEEFAEKITVYLNDLAEKYVVVETDAIIKHQEHKTLKVDKGVYKVVIERERDPFTQHINQVID